MAHTQARRAALRSSTPHWGWQRLRAICVAAIVLLLGVPVAGAQQASLTVRNTTVQPVDIVWLDDSGAEEAIGAVEAGQTVTLDAAVGWTFRATQGGARIAEHTVAGTAGESWEVAAVAPTRSRRPRHRRR